MRLGRKLSEGFAVDRDADAVAPSREGTERTVPVSAEADATADAAARGSAAGGAGGAGRAEPVASGLPPTG